MKRNSLLTAVVSAFLAAALALCANAAFEKKLTYTDGQFKDVKNDAWYAGDVKSAYELGFMNGKSADTMVPDGTVTVAEAVTMASRVHAIYNGLSEVPKTDGKNWYDMYINYAVKNGMFKEGDFNSYDRPVRRYEMAKLFANALPEEYFAPINEISSIPDVNEKEEYADTLLMLYKAGVVLGSDEYGTFHPTNSIKRSEAAAIINRVALPENRKSGVLKALPEYEEAYYIMDDYTMTQLVRGVTRLTSSWNYDNRFNLSLDVAGTTTNVLTDDKTDGYVAINRSFAPESDGFITVRGSFTLTAANSGARMYFENTNGKNVLELYTKDGVFCFKGENDVKSNVKVENGEMFYELFVNLDDKIAKAYINEEEVGEVSLGSFENLTKLAFATTKEDTLTLTPNSVHMYKNYYANEDFASAKIPYDWTVSESAIEKLTDSRDVYTLAVNAGGKAKTEISPIKGGKAVTEVYVYVPEKTDKATVNVGNAYTVTIADGKISAPGVQKTIKNHIWYCIHIESDAGKGKAKVYVNGKHIGDTAMNGDTIDSLVFENTGKGKMYVDDIKVYRVYDYPDYVSAPNVAKSDDMLVIMSVCSIWREGTHFGWDFVSPYEECSPLMGYYDEGIPEAADWEIKIMAEHGVDAMEYCWFHADATDFSTPQKHPNLAWGLHDGYFYAKYSDMVDFCIMWENASYHGGSMRMGLDKFKTYIWDHWVEWYFTDDRYLTVDNKPVLEIYSTANFIKLFGSVEKTKEAIAFMREDIKNYGFDGLILLSCNNGQSEVTAKEDANLGFDSLVAYGWSGEKGGQPDYQKSVYDIALENVKPYNNVTYIPTIGAGWNILGWENIRRHMATFEEHVAVLEHAVDNVEAQKDKKANWDGKAVYLSTWNEYGEGHWLAPTGVHGFDYADAWRKVFTDAPEVHDDAVPTINQKNRICHMYNDTRTPIRQMLSEYDPSKKVDVPDIVHHEWKFETQEDLKGFNPNTHIGTFGIEDGVLKAQCVGGDPQIWSPADLKIDAEKITHIRVRTKLDRLSTSTIFFVTKTNPVWDGAKAQTASATVMNEFTDLYFDMSAKSGWSGEITQIRFDAFDAAGKFEIESIALMSYTPKADTGVGVLSVDGMELDIDEAYITYTDKEFYVTANPANGVFSTLNLYHEWNRFDGTLLLKSSNETELLFTVGSDKVYANGKELKLSKEFYTFDGMPVLPLEFVLKNTGTEYERKDNVLTAKVRGIDFKEVEAQRKKGKFEFTIGGDSEGFTFSASDGLIKDGYAVVTARPLDNGGYDPHMVLTNIGFAAKNYVGIELRMKADIISNEGEYVHDVPTIYFTTSSQTGYSEDKTIKTRLSDHTPDKDGFYTVMLDATMQPLWREVITSIRLDPAGNNGTYTIDYIRFIEGDNSEPLTPEQKAIKDKQEKAIKENSIVYALEFDKPSDIEDIWFGMCTGEVRNGNLVMTSEKGQADLKLDFLKFPEELSRAENMDFAVVRIKIPEEAIGGIRFFYRTDEIADYTGEVFVSLEINSESRDEEGYATYLFDFSKNTKYWKDGIKNIRFDPADYEGQFEIDYMRFYKYND